MYTTVVLITRFACVTDGSGADAAVDLHWRDTGHGLPLEEVNEAKEWIAQVSPMLDWNESCFIVVELRDLATHEKVRSLGSHYYVDLTGLLRRIAEKSCLGLFMYRAALLLKLLMRESCLKGFDCGHEREFASVRTNYDNRLITHPPRSTTEYASEKFTVV